MKKKTVRFSQEGDETPIDRSFNESSWSRHDISEYHGGCMAPEPLSPTYQPEFAQLKDLLLRMTSQRSTQGVMDALVSHLAGERPHAVRACVWLKEADALVLRASEWRHGAREEWTHARGTFERIPLDDPMIGRAVRQRRTVGAPVESAWEGYPEWAARDGVRSFVITPITHVDQVFGCFGGFMSYRFEDPKLWETGLAWTQIFADHMAAMMANAAAFEEIDRLRRQLERENEYLREEVQNARGFAGIIGSSPALRHALDQVSIVSSTDATVLILGESGTGKELIAQSIHDRSKRAGKPFIKVNCAAVPHELFESEFFGHVRGSFTGAVRDRAGRFDLAQGGTLFLDEIGEVPVELQGKLLRVLQEGTYERVGEERTRRADVRIIAATNRDLLADAEAHRFRQDLYYRLSVFPISVPPLRKRREDIALLTDHFAAQFCREHNRPSLWLDEADRRALEEHEWPGNIRELRNVLERAVLVGSLPAFDRGGRPGGSRSDPAVPSERVLTYPELADLEKENLRRALAVAKGRIWGAGGAASRLGLKPTTLASKLKSLGIEPR
ncbi:MAG: sigma 54-interacting transcriptional regulator [Bryobacterales bacterium]|nr:sigma 54-interacting transcriptional regulator [Bryobacterales bacterium]